MALPPSQVYFGSPASEDYQPDREDIVRLHEEQISASDDLRSRLDTLASTVGEIEASGDTVTKKTWAELSAVAGTRDGQRGFVEDDAGSHTDPVTSATVQNQGVYTWVESASAWQWLRADDYAQVSSAVVSLNDAVSRTRQEVVGKIDTPASLSSGVGGTYAFIEPVVHNGQITRVHLYAATAFTMPIRIYDDAGPDLLMASETVVSVAAGLNDLSVADGDFPAIPVKAGQHVGFYSNGSVNYITSQPPYSGGQYRDEADVDDLIAPGTVTAAMQIGFFIDYEEKVASAELEALISQEQIEIIGAPTTPVDGTQGAGGTYAFVDPAEHDGEVGVIWFYLEAAATVPIRIFRKNGTTFTRVSEMMLAGAAGLNVFSAADGDFAAIPIKAGQHAGFWSDGNINYTFDGAYSGGQYRNTGNVLEMSNPTISTASMQIGFKIFYRAPVDVGSELQGLSLGRPSTPMLTTDGTTLHRYRAKAANLQLGGTESIRVGMFGDSWTERPAIPNALKEMLTTEHGETGYGWISCDAMYPLPGLTHANANWTLFDASVDGAPDATIGCSLDGKVITASGTTATVSITVECDEFTIHYFDGSGTFRYRVDGGAWTAVTGAGTNGKESVTLSLADASHTIEIDTTGNVGTAGIYGYQARRAVAGVEVNKCGNGSLDASQLATYLAQVPDFTAALDLDLMIICLGTNDYRRDIPLADYRAAVYGLVDAFRAVHPDCGVIFLGPADSNGSGLYSVYEYGKTMYQLSTDDGGEFVNLFAGMGPFAEANALGQWNDPLHLSAAGARNVARIVTQRLLSL